MFCANNSCLKLLNKFGFLKFDQPVRFNKRSCYRRPWHIPRKISSFWYQKELTSENKCFLKHASNCETLSSPLIIANNHNTKWDTNIVRTGVLSLKIGVVPQWTNDGHKFYCTMLQVLDNHVISYKNPGECQENIFRKPNLNIGTLVVGAMSTGNHKFSEAYCGLFKNAGVLPKRKLSKFAVSPESALLPGTPLNALHFRVGNFVDAQAKTIGHGFQGVVKRWGFKGGPASHGTTKWHRRPGNIGGGRGKAKVFKGKKMPGHMGMEWRITRGLKIWRINTKYNVIYVHGQAVPGPTNCYVRLFDTSVTKKRSIMLQKPPPVPTFLQVDDSERLQENIYADNLFDFSKQMDNLHINVKM